MVVDKFRYSLSRVIVSKHKLGVKGFPVCGFLRSCRSVMGVVGLDCLEPKRTLHPREGLPLCVSIICIDSYTYFLFSGRDGRDGLPGNA